MIRKPPPGWGREESRAVKAARTAAEAANRGAAVARRGGDAARGLFCYFFAGLWGLAALAGLLSGSLPTFLGVGAMAAGMAWGGKRAFAQARGASG